MGGLQYGLDVTAAYSLSASRQTFLEKRVIVRRAEAPDIRSLLVGSADSQLHYILRLQPLWAFCNVEFNAVAFIERFEAFTLNSTVMDKNIVSGIAADESVSLFIVKPLHGSLFSHLFS